LFLTLPKPSFSQKLQADRALERVVATEDFRMGSMSIWHWLVVIVVVLLLFGRGKISELMGDMAQGIKAFKKGMTEDEKAEAAPAASEPVKTIDHQAASGTAKSSSTASANAPAETRKAV
jgi:sec-independent protein translocase protein TatA